MPRPDGINIFHTSLFAQLFSQSFGNTVDTAYGRYNPYLVAYTNVTIFAGISLKGSLLVFDIKRLVYRVVCVFKRSAKIGLEIVFVDPVTCLQVLTGMTDGIAVLNDVFPLFDIVSQWW